MESRASYVHTALGACTLAATLATLYTCRQIQAALPRPPAAATAPTLVDVSTTPICSPRVDGDHGAPDPEPAPEPAAAPAPDPQFRSWWTLIPANANWE